MNRFILLAVLGAGLLAVSAFGGESVRTGKKPAALPPLLRLAIERGAPLYDRGDPDACLAVYELQRPVRLSVAD